MSDRLRNRGGLCWWAMLPDSQAAAPVCSALPAGAAVVARHTSGRPWIVGTLPAGEVHLVEPQIPAEGRLVVLGELLADRAQLDRAARRGVPAVLTLPGSFQLARSGPDGLSVWTDPVGYRQAFRASVYDVVVVADHAGPLGDLLGAGRRAELDPVWLALRMCVQATPAAMVAEHSPYIGVTPLPAGYRLELPAGTRLASGPARCTRWWSPPAVADLDLADGAVLFRQALTTAVEQRVERAAATVTVQLSGGLDSAALALLAGAAHPARLVLATVMGRSPANRDADWARRVSDVLPDAVHRMFAVDEIPAFFDGLPDALPMLDEPVNHAAGAARARHVAAWLAWNGSRLHLNGQGGDEVLGAPLAYLPGLLRRDPRRGWRHLRGHAALSDLRVPALARAAITPVPYRRWLAGLDPRRLPNGPAAALGWELPPILPRWASERTAAAVADELARAAGPAAATPYDRATHAALAQIRLSARRAALYGRAQRLDGLTPAFPYLDRSVVEAALRVEPSQRADPWRVKPLLAEALAPVAPAGVLARRDKSHYNADIYAGWRAHRGRVADLLREPILAELGLVDAAVLARAVATYATDGSAPSLLTDALAVELWLRTYYDQGAQTR